MPLLDLSRPQLQDLSPQEQDICNRAIAAINSGLRLLPDRMYSTRGLVVEQDSKEPKPLLLFDWYTHPTAAVVETMMAVRLPEYGTIQPQHPYGSVGPFGSVCNYVVDLLLERLAKEPPTPTRLRFALQHACAFNDVHWSRRQDPVLQTHLSGFTQQLKTDTLELRYSTPEDLYVLTSPYRKALARYWRHWDTESIKLFLYHNRQGIDITDFLHENPNLSPACVELLFEKVQRLHVECTHVPSALFSHFPATFRSLHLTPERMRALLDTLPALVPNLLKNDSALLLKNFSLPPDAWAHLATLFPVFSKEFNSALATSRSIPLPTALLLLTACPQAANNLSLNKTLVTHVTFRHLLLTHSLAPRALSSIRTYSSVEDYPAIDARLVATPQGVSHIIKLGIQPTVAIPNPILARLLATAPLAHRKKIIQSLPKPQVSRFEVLPTRRM